MKKNILNFLISYFRNYLFLVIPYKNFLHFLFYGLVIKKQTDSKMLEICLGTKNFLLWKFFLMFFCIVLENLVLLYWFVSHICRKMRYSQYDCSKGVKSRWRILPFSNFFFEEISPGTSITTTIIHKTFVLRFTCGEKKIW